MINRNGEHSMYEKLYLIHNPLNGIKDWVSERDFKIGSQKLKNVFGVLYLDDVRIMMHFNNQFKEAVMIENNITDEKNISINHVCQIITKDELMELIEREAKVNAHVDPSSAPSYPSRIELKDGCFGWNSEKECYDEILMVK